VKRSPRFIQKGSVAAAAPKPVESTHLKIIVGVTDDTAK